jgi:hypothetical protein
MNKPGSFKWFFELSDSDYAALIEHLKTTNYNLFKNKQLLAYTIHDDQVRSHVSQFLKAASKANRAKKSAARRLYKLMFKKLDVLFSELAKYGHVQASFGQSEAIIDYSEKLKKNMHTLFTKYDAVETFEMLKGLELSSGLVLLPARTQFPHVNNKLEELNQLALQVGKTPLAVEEQYYVDEAIKNYIPGILKASDAVQQLPSAELNELEKNFMSQVNSVKEQLQQILATANARTMQEVRSQTAFLEAKNAQSQLALPAADSTTLLKKENSHV